VGGLTFLKLTKIPLIYSVSRLNFGELGVRLGALELCMGGAKPTKAPRGDGSVLTLTVYLPVSSEISDLRNF